MAHFARLNENNKVEQVIVISNDEITDENGNEVEELGVDYIHNTLRRPGSWVQTSYNNNFRVRYAGIGFFYDETLDAFIRPKPKDPITGQEYSSWILNPDTADWEAPISKPDDGNEYRWNEDDQSWDLIIRENVTKLV